MKVTSRILAATVVVVLFGGIALSAALNMWSTSPAKEPVKFATGEFAGQANPADIRGSYLFADVEKAFGVPAAVLGKAFGVAADRDPAQFQVKELEASYAGKLPAGQEIGTDSVRLFVAFYKNLPFEPEAGTLLPPGAAAALKALGTLKAEQLAWVDANTLGGAAAAPAVAPAATVATTHTESTEDRAIKGKTTFGDLMLWGWKRSRSSRSSPCPSVRREFRSGTFCQKSLEFSGYKTKLQELVDKLPRSADAGAAAGRQRCIFEAMTRVPHEERLVIALLAAAASSSRFSRSC